MEVYVSKYMKESIGQEDSGGWEGNHSPSVVCP